MEFDIGDYVRFERYLLNDAPENPFDTTYETGYIVDVENVQGYALYLISYDNGTAWVQDSKMSRIVYESFKTR